MKTSPADLAEVEDALSALTDADLELTARAVEAERERRRPAPPALPTYPALACPKCGNVPGPLEPRGVLRGIEYVRVERTTFYLYEADASGVHGMGFKETEQTDVAPMLACCVCGAEYAIPPGVCIT